MTRATGSWTSGWGRDLRYVARTLGRSPGFACAVTTSLGFGTAGVLAAIAFVNGVAFRPFPGVERQADLVDVRVLGRCGTGCVAPVPLSVRDYGRLNAGLKDAGGLAGSTTADVAVALPAARSARVAFVSDNYFEIIGARPARGRLFASGEDNSDAAVISARIWRRDFGADAGVVGRTIGLSDRRVTIRGVAPDGFGGLDVRIAQQAPDVWLPLSLADAVGEAYPGWQVRRPDGQHYMRFTGRVRGGASAASVEGRLALAVEDLDAARGGARGTLLADVRPVTMHDRARFAPLLLLVLAVPIFVLAIACMNTTNLMLARASTRGHDIAMRRALGASRAHVVRLLLLEGAVLASLSTAISLAVVWAGMPAISTTFAVPMPVDTTVALLSVALCAITTIGCALTPALKASRGALRDLGSPQYAFSRPRDTRVRKILVVSQVTLSVALLSATAQFHAALRSIDVGRDVRGDELILATFDLKQVNASPQQQRDFYDQVLRRAAAMPGVQTAGLASPRSVWTFGKGRQADNSLNVWRPNDAPRDGRVCLGGTVRGDLFGAIGVRLQRGRTFDTADGDAATPRVAVVNRAFDDDAFGGHAVGRTIRVAARGSGFASGVDVVIVGVVDDLVEPGYGRGRATPAVYVPVELRPEPARALYLRAAAGNGRLAMAGVSEMVNRIDARLPILELATLADINRKMTPELQLVEPATALGVFALALASWGLYALLTYAISARSRDLALRLMLGATRSRVMSMVLRDAMGLVLAGAALGGIAAYIAGRAIAASFHGVGPGAGAIVIGVVAVQILTALCASVPPCLRVARLQPLEAIR